MVTKKFNVRNLRFVKVDATDEQRALDALNFCSASSCAPVEFDGIPSRQPTPAERMVADKKAPPWYTDNDGRKNRKLDTADYLKTLVCPL